MMTTFANRPYGGPADLEAMVDLLVTARPAERVADYPSIVDLRDMLGMSEIRANTRLWKDAGGQLAGFAILRVRYSSVAFEVAPWAQGSDIVAQMVAWAGERVREVGRGPAEPAVLRTSCRDCHARHIALLEQLGFVPGEERTLHLVRPLGEPIAAPEVPEGFTVRHVAGEHEVEALVALHRAAFGTENMTVEGRLAWMRAPEYDRELDLVAVAPDGTLAAYVLCSISQEENTLTGRKHGYTDPVATHPAFQRRGLARALLLAGLNLLRQRGAEAAWLGTSSGNTAMHGAARSVGFRVESTTVFFGKRVPEA